MEPGEEDFYEMIKQRAAEHPDRCVFCSNPKSNVEITTYDERSETLADTHPLPMCEACMADYEQSQGPMLFSDGSKN